MSTNRRRGFDFERRLVKKFRDHNIPARRAYASNGQSLGEASNVDLIIAGMKCQAKIRKSLPDYLKPDENITAQILGDPSGQYVVIRLEDFCTLLHLMETWWPNKERKISD